MLFTKLHYKTIEWKKRRLFPCMTASTYHVISREVESQIFRHNWIFRHTYVYKQPPLTKKWDYNHILNSCYKYYIVILDTLVGIFLVVLFLLLAVILSGLYEKPRRNKDWVTEKVHRRIFVRDITFLDPFHFIFVAFFVYSPSQMTHLLNSPDKDTYCYGWYSVSYRKYENIL